MDKQACAKCSMQLAVIPYSFVYRASTSTSYIILIFTMCGCRDRKCLLANEVGYLALTRTIQLINLDVYALFSCIYCSFSPWFVHLNTQKEMLSALRIIALTKF